MEKTEWNDKKNIFEKFVCEFKESYKNNTEISSASKDFNYAMELQRNRLNNYGLKIEYVLIVILNILRMIMIGL